LEGDLAMVISQFRLFFQRQGGFAGALPSPRVRLGALATHGQTTAMAETAVATNVHQTLDVHRGFAAQVTLDCKQTDLVTNFFQFGVGQLLDFLGVFDATGFANFASARAANTENGCQANFSVFVGRDVNTCNTSHDGPLKLNQP
jgi:hypothetical protein